MEESLAKFTHVFWLRPFSIDENGCWNWTRATDADGYGRIQIRHKDRKTKNCSAHKLSWRIHKGPIPEGQCVCHKCDNRRCANPDHLFLGDHKANMKDMSDKGRALGCRAKLRCVPEIKARLASGESCSAIARDLGVHRTTIGRIKNGKVYKYDPPLFFQAHKESSNG
jgi:hypothetical protein